MTVATQILARPLSCPACNERVDVRSPYVVVAGAAVRVYCSEDCLRARDLGPAASAPIATAERPIRRSLWWLAGGIVVGTTCLAISYASDVREAEEPIAVPPAAAFFAPAPEPAPPSRPPAPASVEPSRAADDAVIAELVRDAWLHPLAGPARRMPVNHNGAFGAERPGERAPECVSGHCGVDLGQTWGEPVHAVHGGVIDYVNRGPNEERGGMFVKIAHRGGRLYTWYFHLAAVPRWIRAGTKVTAGQVIGLLGDTGVKRSGPHLHFSISVKPSKVARERYLDPEPLIAIWPLWIPNENQSSGRLSTVAEPGLPVRGPGRRRATPGSRARATSEPAAPEPIAPEPAAPDAQLER